MGKDLDIRSRHNQAGDECCAHRIRLPEKPGVYRIHRRKIFPAREEHLYLYHVVHGCTGCFNRLLQIQQGQLYLRGESSGFDRPVSASGDRADVQSAVGDGSQFDQ